MRARMVVEPGIVADWHSATLAVFYALFRFLPSHQALCLVMQPGMCGAFCGGFRAPFNTLPDLLVKVEAHRVAQRFDSRY